MLKSQRRLHHNIEGTHGDPILWHGLEGRRGQQAGDWERCIYKATLARGASGWRKGAVTYFPGLTVSSAWQGLTSLFGMGRGGSLALSPP